MTRTQAARLIERLRIIVAEANEGRRTISPEIIADILSREGIDSLYRCDGEAHRNPHIDNCGMCAPRWGWLGAKVVVR
jgi:hypothetical protein